MVKAKLLNISFKMAENNIIGSRYWNRNYERCGCEYANDRLNQYKLNIGK